MLSAVIISSDALRREILQRVTLESNHVLAARLWDRFPYPYELTQMMNTVAPDIAFLDYTDYSQADGCAAQIETDYPNTVIIGFGGTRVPDDPGVTAFLPHVPEVAEFSRIIEQAVCKVRGVVLENLVAFLPAKAGSGCSTVVLNTAAMLSGPLQRKALVIEGDLRSGALSVFLNCVPEWFAQDALKSAGEMDSTKLNQCVLQKHGVDWMFANPASRDPLPAWHHYFRLLEFVKDKYASILVDLPELVNPASVEIVRRSRLVFVVCTPEVASLKLARRRCDELSACGIPAERVRIVLNRWHKLEIGRDDVEKFLDHPVQATLPSDYHALRSATIDGKCLAESSTLGRAFLDLARGLVDAPVQRQPALPKFLGFLRPKSV
jgi:pilus assembly protein CpaE